MSLYTFKWIFFTISVVSIDGSGASAGISVRSFAGSHIPHFARTKKLFNRDHNNNDNDKSNHCLSSLVGIIFQIHHNNATRAPFAFNRFSVATSNKLLPFGCNQANRGKDSIICRDSCPSNFVIRKRFIWFKFKSWNWRSFNYKLNAYLWFNHQKRDNCHSYAFPFCQWSARHFNHGSWSNRIYNRSSHNVREVCSNRPNENQIDRKRYEEVK